MLQRFDQPAGVCFRVTIHWSKCAYDARITLLDPPLAYVRGFLSWCKAQASHWCVWRWREFEKGGGIHKQWLTSLLPDRRLVLYQSAPALFYVTKVVGSVPVEQQAPRRALRLPAYSPAEGPLTARSPEFTFSDSEQRAFNLDAIIVERPANRYEGTAAAEGARYDLGGGRFLVIEGGKLVLKEGTTVLDTWGNYKVIRYDDGRVEVHSPWIKRSW